MGAAHRRVWHHAHDPATGDRSLMQQTILDSAIASSPETTARTVTGSPSVVRQFVTFAVVGAVSTGCHFLVLFALHEWAGLGVVAATSWGAAVGAVVNYILNRRVTFAGSGAGAAAIPRFALVALTGLGLNSGSMALLEQAIPQVHYLVRQCFVTGLVLLYSFSMNKWWTFRGRSASGNARGNG